MVKKVEFERRKTALVQWGSIASVASKTTVTRLPLFAACILLLAAGCRVYPEAAASSVLVIEASGPLPETPEAPTPIEPEDEPVEVDEPLQSPPDSSAAEATQPLFPEPPIPEAVSATIGRGGGELVSGEYSAVIPGMNPPVEAEWIPQSFDQIREPRPLSTPLAVAELVPRYSSTDSMMELVFPLRMEIPQGMRLQLLAFNRSMDAFTVVDERTVSADGLARFRANYFSQYVVIAQPELQELGCPGEVYNIGETYPAGARESRVTGSVPLENRMPRETALLALTDLRYVAEAVFVQFKDEERYLVREGEPRYDEEDYLLDPRAAASLVWLGRHVLAQWTDPISEGPAYQLRVTDSYDSLIEHSPTSNHYRGLAVDLTLSPVPPASNQARRETYGRLSQLAVCAGFDYVHFENRFHAHVSSHPTRIAYLEERPMWRGLVVSDLDGLNRQVISDEVELSMEDLDVRSLVFQDAQRLELFGRRKGVAVGYRIDLEQSAVEELPIPEEMPESPDVIMIDESLLVLSGDSRIVLRRPSDPPAYWGELPIPEREPFILSEEGVRGWRPAVWSHVEFSRCRESEEERATATEVQHVR